MFLYLSKVLPVFLYPLGLSIVLVVLAGLLLHPRRIWLVRVLCLSTFALLFVFGSPITSRALLDSLERQYPGYDTARAPRAEAIVVLGGVVRGPSGPRRNIEMTESSDRLIEAIRLWRARKAPLVLMSGGNIDFLIGPGQTPESQLMRQFVLEFGLPADSVLSETASRNTYENAEFSKRMLEKRGIRRILLVTSAFHMPRSVAIFRRAGFEVFPATTDFISDGSRPDPIFDWLPSAESLGHSTLALKEIVGLAVYRLRGWA